ncbi:MAG: VWA domain-containing protein [Lentisphaeria bacterium]
MPEFSYIYNLIWLLPTVICFIIAIKRRPASLLYSSKKHLDNSGAVKFSVKRNLPDFLYLISAFFIIIALTGPRYGKGNVIKRSDGIDIMLVFDVSGSMSYTDIPEYITDNNTLNKALKNKTIVPRIDVAKEALLKFIEARPYDRIGLVSFAALPFTICPPTLDHQFLASHLTRIQAGMYDQVAPGTALASPIAIATNSLKSSNAKRRVIVLFTDGANNVSETISPMQAADLAVQYNINIYTIAIGSNQAIIPGRGFFGPSIVRDQYDKSLLKQIAQTSKGMFMQVDDNDSFNEAMNEINLLEKTSVVEQKFTSYQEFFPFFVLCAIIIMAIAFILENTICLRIP